MEGRRGQVSERTLQDNLSVMKMNPLFIVSALNRYIKFDSIDVLVVSGLNSRTISILDLIRTEQFVLQSSWTSIQNKLVLILYKKNSKSKSVARIPHKK